MSSRNSSVVIPCFSSGKNGLIFVTRERIDLIPLDSIFSFFTFSALTTSSMSESNMIVPCANIRPFVAYIAFPENFKPSITRSLRPFNSAPEIPNSCNAWMIGLVTFAKSRNESPSSGMMKLKFKLPKS